MNNVARLPITNAPGIRLGPATVTRVAPDAVDVRLVKGDAHVRALVALAVPYEPCVGDLVLVIGDADDHYVIGVLRGSGRTTLAIEGDVDLRAIGGELRLSADRGVKVDGSEIALRATKIETDAETIVERSRETVQRVDELLTVRAGATHTVVADTSFTQAKSAAIVAEEKVTVNGKGIYLG